MNLNALQSKLKFPLLLIFLVFLVFFALLIYTLINREKSPSSQISPSVAPNTIVPPEVKSENLPEEVKQIRQKIITSQIENRAGDILLFKSTSYEIEYIPTPDVFFVKIIQDPAQKYKEDAQKWFLKFGLKQNQLCDLPVRFLLTSQELRKSNQNFTSLPDECTGTTLTKPN